MQLIKVRECDAACCKSSPRWPTPEGTSCEYLDADNCCKIMTGEVELPCHPSPALPKLTAEETFRMCCMEWPQQHCEQKIGETADCCWQWIDGN